MPISSFSDGLQKVISFLPGTYGTSLFRNHAMNGALKALQDEGIPEIVVDSLRDAVDCNIYFFDNKVEPYVMYIVLISSIVVLVGAYVLLNIFRKKDK